MRLHPRGQRRHLRLRMLRRLLKPPLLTPHPLQRLLMLRHLQRLLILRPLRLLRPRLRTLLVQRCIPQQHRERTRPATTRLVTTTCLTRLRLVTLLRPLLAALGRATCTSRATLLLRSPLPPPVVPLLPPTAPPSIPTSPATPPLAPILLLLLLLPPRMAATIPSLLFLLLLPLSMPSPWTTQRDAQWKKR